MDFWLALKLRCVRLPKQLLRGRRLAEEQTRSRELSQGMNAFLPARWLLFRL